MGGIQRLYAKSSVAECVLLGPTALLSWPLFFLFVFFNVTFSFVVVWLHPVQAVVESSALPAVSLRHEGRFGAS